MGRKSGHKRGKVSRSHDDRAQREKDLETIRLVNEIFETEPVDTAMLRKIASVRGLVNDQMRRKVWPHILGVDPRQRETTDLVKQHSSDEHRDTRVVKADTERSLFNFTSELDHEARLKKQEELNRVITAVIASHPDNLYYYQGFHDIAGVMMLVLGEENTYLLLERLALHHLRDCTRSDLQPVMQTLLLVPPLIEKADPELGQFIQASECPPYYALVWMLTWHAHDIGTLSNASRLFDLFIASNPLMPMYVGVTALLAARDSILSQPCDLAQVHGKLSKLPMLDTLHVDTLCHQALHLSRQYPPHSLIKRSEAQLVGSPVNAFPYNWMAPAQPNSHIICTCHLCDPTIPEPPVKQVVRVTGGMKRVAKVSGYAVAALVGLAAAAVSVGEDEMLIEFVKLLIPFY